MVKRLDVNAILQDLAKRKRLMIATLIATQAREGITTTWEQAERAYEKIQEERKKIH